MLPNALRQIFPAAVRDRGERYRRQVRFASTTSTSITALVRGTRQYIIEVDAVEGAITVCCTCPSSGEHGVCKHCWAVLVVADEKHLLSPLIGVAGRHAVFSGVPDDIDPGTIDNGVDDAGEFDHGLEDRFDLFDLPPVVRAPRPPRRPPAGRKSPPPRDPEWKRMLVGVQRQSHSWPSVRAVNHSIPAWPDDRRISYVIDIITPAADEAITVEVRGEKRRRDGTWDATKALRAPLQTWLSAPDPADRQIIQMLAGAADPWGYGPYYAQPANMRTTFTLGAAAFDTVLALVCATGRCTMRVAEDGREQEIKRWDGGGPWRFALQLRAAGDGTHSLSGVLARGEERIPFGPPLAAHHSGIILNGQTLARADFGGAFELAGDLYRRGSVPFAATELPELIDTILALPGAPALAVGEGLALSERREPPIPCLVSGPGKSAYRSTGRGFDLSFLYGDRRVERGAPGAAVFDRASKTLHHRDVAAERRAEEELIRLGARERQDFVTRRLQWSVPDAKWPALLGTLAAREWRVDVGGVVNRAFTGARAELRSGIDWFDLDASVQYGDQTVSLTALLDAERQGEPGVALPDGSLGLLPSEWLDRWRTIAAGGTAVNGVTRFTRAQTALLDALVESMPEVSVDETFETARAELRRFDRIAPADAPPSFTGTLREYQREGLGWLHFLRQFRLGGCLADDMGLGKTIQVLALLESRRADRAANGPSMVIVPRSLVRNWIREAERFTPSLRVLDYSRPDRASTLDLDTADLVIITYGVLRREAPRLAGVEFDYAILDEAQAIKNSGTASAKAARLLRASHRLAVTGTPVENRLEELWSIFEFLNPGMLGGHSGFGRLVRSARASSANGPAEAGPSGDPASLMSRALKPVILRRTKQVVAKELPARTEQTIEVELEPAQRRFYDGILARYRASVLDRVDRLGMGKSRMHILEALLRLRQAACHPALADARKTALPSAKLDALIPSLAELAAEGHKVLVFSQFTSFLSIVRARLDGANLCHEYLDGSTRDRQKRVDRFQSDAACPIFLISLKAGGQGLNLTAADYVYLLDPWWNPAVEAQAIDRAHRIGQSRHVIATRLVARGTIEEKILQLQASKRALADAILTEDQGLLSGIARDDLVSLLS